MIKEKFADNRNDFLLNQFGLPANLRVAPEQTKEGFGARGIPMQNVFARNLGADIRIIGEMGLILSL